MLCFIKSLQCFALSELEQRDFGRDEPAEEEAEDDVVAEGNDVLDLPEDGTRVTVVVVTQWDVLASLSALQEGLDMFEEPGFVPAPDLIQFAGLAAVHHVTRHNYRPLLGEHQTLNKVRRVAPLHLPLEGLDHLVQGVDGGVVQLHEALAGHDVNLHADEEAEGAVAPGDGVEQVRVIVGGAGHHRAIGQH